MSFTDKKSLCFSVYHVASVANGHCRRNLEIVKGDVLRTVVTADESLGGGGGGLRVSSLSYLLKPS